MSEEIITNSIDKSKYFYTKAEKILSYRKKYSSIRHEYFVMAQKYMSYNKVLLTFTVPTDRKDKSIKNGRYTKLRTLIEIRAYIAKLLNNSSDVKYFMNIELGEHYSNPHLHLQLWYKTTSSLTTNIFEKTISKFNLNKNRCYITEPTHAVPIYNYVIKDYAKDLSDKQIWDLETQKKRFRKVMGSKVRFYSKSRDEFSKKIYRKIYYGMGILRKNANEFINFFIDNFFYFNKRNLPKISSFVYCFSELSNTEQEQLLCILLLLRTIFAAWGKWSVAVLFYSPARDPPCVYCFIIFASEKLKLKGLKMITKELLSVLLNTNVTEVYIRKGAMRFKTSNDRGDGWVSDSDTPIPPIHELSDKAIDWIESQGFWIKKEHKEIYALMKGADEVYGIDTKKRIDVPFMCMQWILDNKMVSNERPKSNGTKGFPDKSFSVC